MTVVIKKWGGDEIQRSGEIREQRVTDLGEWFLKNI